MAGVLPAIVLTLCATVFFYFRNSAGTLNPWRLSTLQAANSSFDLFPKEPFAIWSSWMMGRSPAWSCTSQSRTQSTGLLSLVFRKVTNAVFNGCSFLMTISLWSLTSLLSPKATLSSILRHLSSVHASLAAFVPFFLLLLTLRYSVVPSDALVSLPLWTGEPSWCYQRGFPSHSRSSLWRQIRLKLMSGWFPQ